MQAQPWTHPQQGSPEMPHHGIYTRLLCCGVPKLSSCTTGRYRSWLSRTIPDPAQSVGVFSTYTDQVAGLFEQMCPIHAAWPQRTSAAWPRIESVDRFAMHDMEKHSSTRKTRTAGILWCCCQSEVRQSQTSIDISQHESPKEESGGRSMA